MKIVKLLLLGVLLTFFGTALSQPPTPTSTPLLLNDEKTILDLKGHLDMAWEPTGEVPFEEILRGPRALTFSSFENQPKEAERAVLWVRLVIKNEGAQTAHWVLRCKRFPSYESVEVYRPPLPLVRVDNNVAVSAREFFDAQPAFRVELRPNESQEVYLRIEPNIGWDFVKDPTPDLKLVPQSLWQEGLFYRVLGQGAFFAFLIVIALSQSITIALEPDRSRVWYVVLLLSYLIYFGAMTNLTKELFIPYLTEWFFAPLGISLVAVANAGFVSSYLDLRSVYPKIRQALFIFAALTALLNMGSVVVKILFEVENNALVVPLTNLCTGSLIITAVLTTIKRVRQGYRPARFLLAGSGVFALTAFMMIFMFVGVLPGSEWGPTIFQIGAVVECLVLSVAVADRLLWIRKEKEQAQLILQQRGQEISSLRSELDHQLVSRSRDLTQVLAFSGAPSIQPQPSPGDTFEGRYRIIKPLGTGGMGVVFMVERASDSKRLALKLLRGAATGVDAARFTREAEISARMTHPNLVKLFDVGLSLFGSPYIVMELLEGGSLDDERAHFGEVSWALPLLSGVVKGIGALHQAGIIHRDLKPSNILLERSAGGFIPRVADFGISRYGADQTPQEPQEPTSGTATTMGVAQLGPKTPELTMSGAIMGTPRYMPPEAVDGARMAGPAWDIFSFGVMAYEMLTGRSPFEGVPVRLALQGKPLPPVLVSLEGLSAIPRPVAMVLMACLAESPMERPTASVLEDCLSIL